jgi:hypothetical protein
MVHLATWAASFPKGACSRRQTRAPWTASNQNSEQRKEEDEWCFLPCISHCCSIGGSGRSGSGINGTLTEDGIQEDCNKKSRLTLMCSPLQQSMSYFDWCRNQAKQEHLHCRGGRQDCHSFSSRFGESHHSRFLSSWVAGFDDALKLHPSWALVDYWSFSSASHATIDALLLGNCIHMQQESHCSRGTAAPPFV